MLHDLLISWRGALVTRREAQIQSAQSALADCNPLDLRPGPDCRWDFDDAKAEVESMQRHLYTVGWYCSLGGSVLTHGEGRDLDLIFLPVFADPAERDWLVDVLRRRWGKIVDRHMSTFDRVLQVVFEDEDERLIDCMFWRTVNDELKVVSKREAELEDAMEAMGG